MQRAAGRVEMSRLLENTDLYLTAGVSGGTYEQNIGDTWKPGAWDGCERYLAAG